MTTTNQRNPSTTPAPPTNGFKAQRRVLSIAGCGLILAAVAACGSSATSSKNTTSQVVTSTNASAPASSQSSPTTAVITISSFAFTTPATVAPGTVITVINNDDANHTVTADSGSAFDDKATAGNSTTFTAPTKPGSYAFHCIYHANMHGVLVVS